MKKKKKKGMSITLSESDDENEEETTNKMMAFTRKYDYGSDSSDKDISKEELAEIYILSLTQWRKSAQPLQVWKRKSHY